LAGSVGSLRPLEKVSLGLESISEIGLVDGISYLSAEFVAGTFNSYLPRLPRRCVAGS
jgi:hypothetical protein